MRRAPSRVRGGGQVPLVLWPPLVGFHCVCLPSKVGPTQALARRCQAAISGIQDKDNQVCRSCVQAAGRPCVRMWNGAPRARSSRGRGHVWVPSGLAALVLCASTHAPKVQNTQEPRASRCAGRRRAPACLRPHLISCLYNRERLGASVGDGFFFVLCLSFFARPQQRDSLECGRGQCPFNNGYI